MPTTHSPFALLRIILTCAAAALAGSASDAAAQAPGKAAAKAGDASSDVAKFCANIAPSAEEARIAFQMKRLGELEGRVKQRVADLEKSSADARDWVTKREAMLKSATDDLVAIYAKMRPEAAATQISAMEDGMAAALLSKLNPRAASAILGEIEAPRASRLTSLLAGAATEGKRS